MNLRELGAANAILHKIQTMVDGGLQVTLSFSTEDIELVQKLMKLKASSEPLVMVAFMQEDNGAYSE